MIRSLISYGPRARDPDFNEEEWLAKNKAPERKDNSWGLILLYNSRFCCRKNKKVKVEIINESVDEIKPIKAIDEEIPKLPL